LLCRNAFARAAPLLQGILVTFFATLLIAFARIIGMGGTLLLLLRMTAAKTPEWAGKGAPCRRPRHQSQSKQDQTLLHRKTCLRKASRATRVRQR
jgi:hypothetical protein